MSAWEWLGAWTFASLLFGWCWYRLRTPVQWKPSPFLTHTDPECMGLWLECYGKNVLECVGCGARAEATPANVAEARWMVQTEAELVEIEERANNGETWRAA